MLVKQVPNELHSLENGNFRVSVLFQIELNQLPLVLHLAQLSLKLAFFGGDCTNFNDFINDFHCASVLEHL